MEIISPASYLGSSNWSFEESKAANWTPEENKRFENALALFDKDTPDRWYNVARMIPGKTVSDVMRQYRELVEDVSDIEAGLIPIPGYMANSFTLEWVSAHGYDDLKQFYAPGGKRHASARSSDHERKKGVPWTEEEHRQFLLGLKKYGKGDWRSISRNFVTTRTPTQVASHAQKYFIRQHSGGKDKRRSSIHDITTVNVSDQNKSSPPFEHKRSPSTDIKSSSLVLKPAQNSNVNGFRLPQSFYGYGSLPNDVGGGTMAFSLSDRSSATESVPHQRSGFEQKPRDRNAQYSISLHGFQLGDYNTVFQM